MSNVGSDHRVPTGLWGGEHVAMTVTAGGAHLEFDCATGEIEKPLVVDDEGRFAIEGVFIREQGGPVRSDAQPNRQRTSYSGRIAGKTMNLTATSIESKKPFGNFVLEFGRDPTLTKCR